MNVDPIKFVFVSVSFFVVAYFFEVNSYSVALRVTGIINVWRNCIGIHPALARTQQDSTKNAFISIEWNKRIICEESKQSKKKRFYYCSKTSFEIMQVSGTFIFTSVFVFWNVCALWFKSDVSVLCNVLQNDDLTIDAVTLARS